MKTVNLAVRLFVELCMIAAFAHWGFTVSAGVSARIVLGVDAPAAVAFMWGLLVAPRASHRLLGAAIMPRTSCPSRLRQSPHTSAVSIPWPLSLS